MKFKEYPLLWRFKEKIGEIKISEDIEKMLMYGKGYGITSQFKIVKEKGKEDKWELIAVSIVPKERLL